MSNFSCSLTRNITSHSMENLAFLSLLRWKMIIIQILATPLMHFLFERLGEGTFWAQEWDMIGLFSWCLRSNRGMHCVIIFAAEWLVVINNIEWRRARAVAFSVEFWRMLESTQTSQTCVLWDVPVFFSYTQGEKTSHTGLKFCPPPPLPPAHCWPDTNSA